jgi:signal transduction histidine kinase
MSANESSESRCYVRPDGSVDLAKLTHDLRSPLNGVLGFGKLLHDGKAGALSEQQREIVVDILQGGQALLGVVSRLEEEARGGA